MDAPGIVINSGNERPKKGSKAFPMSRIVTFGCPSYGVPVKTLDDVLAWRLLKLSGV